MLDLGLEGHTALVTGGNSGIGEATAKALAAEGVSTIIHFLDDDDIRHVPGVRSEAVHRGRAAAEDVKKDVEKAGGRAELVPGDLTRPETVGKLFNVAHDCFGPVSLLINNAAHCESPDTLATTSPGSIDRHFQINTKVPVLLTQAFVRQFDPARHAFGRVVGVSTDAAQTFAGQISYGASKAALEAYTRSMALEVADRCITVNAVAPGPIQTGVYAEEFVRQFSPEIPMGRFGRPEEIADVIVLLCSRQTSYLTGQVIKVSGGHNL